MASPTNDASKEPRSCIGCRHFLGDPEDLERTFPEILILSSTYGSTRGEAGVCQLTQTFRDPRFYCERYEPLSDEASRENL